MNSDVILPLLTAEGEGMGQETNHTTVRKPGTPRFIKYSLDLDLAIFKITFAHDIRPAFFS
jgi:hypothetical protein